MENQENIVDDQRLKSAEETIEKIKSEVPETPVDDRDIPFGDRFQWEVLLRIKGKPGVWLPTTKPRKNNTIGAIKLFSSEMINVNLTVVQVLANFYCIKDTEAKEINKNTIYTISEMMTNLHTYKGGEPVLNYTADPHSPSDVALIQAICPGIQMQVAAPFIFKKLIEWYNYLTINIAKLSK